jgi:hypothetical protein
MAKFLLPLLLMFTVFGVGKAQNIVNVETPVHSQSFGIQGGLSLLENPFALYPVVNFSYSKTIMGHKRHRLAVLSQLGTIVLPDIETKFLFSTSLQYKYVSKKRFEANIFLGVNYQLRKLSYDRYLFEDNMLVNKGSFLHQFGPTLGVNVGYKIIKNQRFSISPFLGISLTKLNKDYQSDLFTGYKPSLTLGLTFNN